MPAPHKIFFFLLSFVSLTLHVHQQVTSASNGKIAMELMKTKTFDICFMDFLMPVMSGVDAIVQHYEWLLGDHDRTHNKDMLVVGLSESTTDDELKLVFNHGCHFFCTKPPETHILSSIISLKRQSADLEGAIAAIRDELDGRARCGYPTLAIDEKYLHLMQAGSCLPIGRRGLPGSICG